MINTTAACWSAIQESAHNHMIMIGWDVIYNELYCVNLY